MVSASFPAAAVLGLAPAYAQQTVEVAGPTTASAVDAQIATKIATPSRDLKVTVTAAGEVSSPDFDISLNPLPGQGDGTITFSNAGKVGSLNKAGDGVADFVAVTLNGAPAKSDNSITVTNSGLVTGGISAGTFGAPAGGTASVTNQAGGKVFNGISANAIGDAKIDSAAGSFVSSGGLTARSVGQTKTDTADGKVTQVTKSGTATVLANGTVASPDGKTRGDVSATSLSGATVVVGGTAGNVTAIASGATTSVFLEKAPALAAGKSVTTVNSSTTQGPGVADVAVSGDVTGVFSSARTTNKVAIDGKVGGGGVTAGFDAASNTTQVSTTTLSEDSKFIAANTSESTAVATGPATSVVIGAGATLGQATTASPPVISNVNARGVTSATVTNAGAVVGNITAQTNQNSSNTTNSSKNTNDGKGSTTFASSSSSTPVGGAASVSVAAGGSVGGFVNGAPVGGGNVSAFSNAGAAIVSNAGVIRGNVGASTIGTTSKSSSSNATTVLADTKSTRFDGASLTQRSAVGGTASFTNEASGIVDGGVSLVGDAGASLTNAGTIGRATNPQGSTSIIVDSQRTIETLAQNSSTTTNSDDGLSSVSSSSNKTVSQTVGGKASFTNAATGLITGEVRVESLGDATVSNSGTVRGRTEALSTGTTVTSTFDNSSSSVTTVGKAPALNSTVTSSKLTSANSTVNTGGSVTGTYAGANGTLNFTPAVDGSVTQTANKDSIATVSGTIFGSLNSTAGSGADSASTFTTVNGSTLDTDNTGSRTFSTSSKTTNQGLAGASSVTVSGLVGDGNASGAAISSTGTSKSSLALSGKVEGNASVTATGVSASSDTFAREYAQTVTKGVNRTTSLTESTSSTSNVTLGSATADLTGKASVLGNLTVNGNSDAAATLAAGTSVGSKTVNGNLSVTAGTGSVSSFDRVSTYSFDAKTKLSNSTETTKSSFGRAVEAAPASATVAGTVNGFTSVNGAGDATLTLTGVARDGANVSAAGTRSSNTQTINRSGISATPGGESFGAVTTGLTTVSNSQTSEVINVGGKAAITVNTAADLQTAGTAATNGSLTASGFKGASVNVGAGSIVRGAATASSSGTDSKFSQTETFTFDPTFATVNGQSLKLESTSTNTGVGGTASIVNAGTVEGGLSAFGATGATVENSGKVGTPTSSSFVSVIAGTESSTTSVVSTNRNNPALRQDVTTATTTSVGGTASFTNSKGATLFGGASVVGKTGTVVNNGAITGTVSLGQGVNDFTKTTTQKAGSTVTEFTQPATRLVQTYTVDQNGVSRGFNVTGATITVDDGAGGTKTLRTSDVNATINLNKGSATLGSITAQTDAKTGERLTNTTVNLNESGFLGADFFGSGTIKASDLQGRPTPLLILPEKVGPLFGAADGFVTTGPAISVRGVANLNKTGAGTFVITGTPYVAPGAPGTKAQWTLDVGALNNKAGELQLALPAFADAKAEFGILGNVNNDAALVLGRRIPATVSLVGDSLVNAGPETIDGITVRQQGNFVQSKAGSLVVGLTPSLVRFSPLSVPPSGAAPEPLGPVQAGVAVPFFTTVDRAGLVVGNSALNITGDLNLGGTVQVDVTRDSLFTNGDGYTLITYTGKGDVTATVTPSVSSKFVNFALKHDTAARTVTIAAARASYATGATDPNAAAAATAFDTALTAAVTRIRSDAGGGAAFQTVSQIGFAQDIANIATALDYRLNAEQAAQVFRELSSAEIYGSLSSLNQNVAFGDTVNILTVRRAQGGELGTSLWVNPVGNFARYGGTSSGASRIRATSYGAAFGLDFAYSEDGVLGIGGAYAEHDLQARGTPEEADARTWTIGAYVHQRFDQFYANALFAYGFTRFNVQRDLTLLARSVESSFRGNQVDASLEVGYDFQLGGAVVTPYVEGALRRFSLNDFTETGGGGIGLDVDGRSKSIFSPTLGVRLGGDFDAGTNVTIRPFARGSFTFQGNLGADRTVRYVGGGNDFTLIGVRPDDFGTIDLGFDTSFGERLNLFLTGGYSFGGSNKVGSVRGGVNFRF